MDNLKHELRYRFVIAQNMNLEVKTKYIKKELIRTYMAKSISTCLSYPLIFQQIDLVELQLKMCNQILITWGVKNEDIKIIENSKILNTIVQRKSKEVMKKIKIPITRTIGMSHIFCNYRLEILPKYTGALGDTVSQLSYRYLESIKEGDDADILDIFNEKAINNLLEKNIQEAEKNKDYLIGYLY